MKTALTALALAACLACQNTPCATDEAPAVHANVEVIVLEHMEAAEAADVLTQLVASASAGGSDPEVVITADEATNSLLVSAPEATLAELKTLVVALDKQPAAGR